MENGNIPFVQKHIYFYNSFLIHNISAVSLAYREMTSRYDTRIVNKRIVI